MASQQPDAGAAETGQPVGGLPGPGRWRKKPVEITAIQFTGSNVEEIWDAFGAAGIYGPTEKNPDHLILTTVHGDPAPCRPGDWVIPDARPDTFYPCKPDIFAATYEPAETPPATESTDWCVAWGGEDANDCAGRLEYDDEAEAREHVPWITGSFVARRTVTKSRWETVPDGSSDEEAGHG